AKASSRIDLPAPVSPVSTARPPAKSISSRSINTMSRIESRVSMSTPSRAWSDESPPERVPNQPDRVAVHRRVEMATEPRRFGRPRLVLRSRRETFNGLTGTALFARPDRLVRSGIPAHAKRLEGLADPGTLVFLRFAAARPQQALGVLVT